MGRTGGRREQLMSPGTCARPEAAATWRVRHGGSAGRPRVGAGRFEEAIVHGIEIDPRPGPAPTVEGPAIEVGGLERRYGDFHAVRGISFEVHAGEVFALHGVNGAANTSALELVEGLSAP